MISIRQRPIGLDETRLGTTPISGSPEHLRTIAEELREQGGIVYLPEERLPGCQKITRPSRVSEDGPRPV